MKILKFFAVISMVILLFLFNSCQQNDDNQDDTTDVFGESQDIENGQENDESVIDTPEDEIKLPEYVNVLTGLETTEFLSNQRPLAIMFNNIAAALPQVGISSMDVLYEITVEGAITRLMGVVNNWATLPTIGSVRSSRDYFIDISDAHNAIYVHAGGSTYAYSELQKRGTERIDGTNGNSASTQAFYRDKERMKTMALEHTLVTSGEKLANAIAKNDFRTTYKDGFKAPFAFSATDTDFDGSDANYVYIPFSYYAQSYLDYNAETKLYSKGQYLGRNSSVDKHDSPHIDGLTGKALEFKNVLVLFAKHSSIAGDTAGRISVDFTGSGTGYYVSNGKCKNVVWKKDSRTSSYSLYEEDGMTVLLMNPGKTYVAIAPTNAEIICK